VTRVVATDIVKSVERQFKLLGDELAKERFLRQAAEDALHNVHAFDGKQNLGATSGHAGAGLSNGLVGVGLNNGGFAGVGISNALASVGLANNLGAGGVGNGNALNVLAGLLQGQEAQLVPSLLKAIVDLSHNKGG
jgi:hypothetical protein